MRSQLLRNGFGPDALSDRGGNYRYGNLAQSGDYVSAAANARRLTTGKIALARRGIPERNKRACVSPDWLGVPTDSLKYGMFQSASRLMRAPQNPGRLARLVQQASSSERVRSIRQSAQPERWWTIPWLYRSAERSRKPFSLPKTTQPSSGWFGGFLRRPALKGWGPVLPRQQYVSQPPSH